MQLVKWNWSILDQYFDTETMSIHIKANTRIMSKKWKPWWWTSHYTDNVISQDELLWLIDRLYMEIGNLPDSWLEIDRKYSKVLQIWPYRIVIVHEPLSDGLEMTVVKPVKKLSIEDYQLDSGILDLLSHQAKWILISGSPGGGKTTFAQALVEVYVQNDKIVKTVEAPRDLMVPEEVVQYSFSYGPHYEVRDILLLSRPDTVIYDEIRNKEDFELFKDLRLTGIWLIWVIHATAPVDSIQRFIWSIEMGIIPQVVDTVIYISWGQIEEILQLETVVKTPSGMNSADLARPVIEVKSFLDKKLKYEIYTYWEQVVVMPMDKINNDPQDSIILEIANDSLQKEFEQLFDFPIRIQAIWAKEINIYVASKNKWQIIGKWWSNIQALENQSGLRINVLEDNSLEKDIYIWGISWPHHPSSKPHKKKRK